MTLHQVKIANNAINSTVTVWWGWVGHLKLSSMRANSPTDLSEHTVLLWHVCDPSYVLHKHNVQLLPSSADCNNSWHLPATAIHTGSQQSKFISTYFQSQLFVKDCWKSCRCQTVRTEHRDMIFYCCINQPHHSAETAILSINNNMIKVVDEGNTGALSLLDLPVFTAFDTIDHSIFKDVLW